MFILYLRCTCRFEGGPAWHLSEDDVGLFLGEALAQLGEEFAEFILATCGVSVPRKSTGKGRILEDFVEETALTLVLAIFAGKIGKRETLFLNDD